MRIAPLLAVVLIAVATAGAQKPGTPTFYHHPVKTGVPNTLALLEIGDPDVSSPGRYTTADVIWALPSTSYPGRNLPPFGMLLLDPANIIGSMRVRLREQGFGWLGFYWTTCRLYLPYLPRSLRGLTLDSQVLAHKTWWTGPVSRLSTKSTFVLY